MSRVIYVNGAYLPWAEAGVHAEDRGFQFADAVYEVCEVSNGALIDQTRHLARLERSLGELEITMPMGLPALELVMRETVRRNRVRDGILYLQVSRGAGPRDFLFPSDDVAPTLVCLARAQSPKRAQALAAKGIAVKSVPNIRWGRCDIKTVMLLPAILAKQAAKGEGAGEAWLVDNDGMVAEGASSNAWIIDAKDQLITRQIDTAILRGVTRTTVLDILESEGISLVERKFSLEEAKKAKEAFITSATSIVMPVVSIDGGDIGDGRPGPVARKLRARFHKFAETAH